MSDSSLKLLFARRTVVAGETIQGEVELDFKYAQKEAIEEVQVKLSGVASSKIDRRGQIQILEEETRNLILRDRTLWTRGSAYPPAGQHILRLAFRFKLPDDLPPTSYYSNAFSASGHITYTLEIIGVRSGTFQPNRRISRPFTVVPPDLIGIGYRAALQAGFSDEWVLFSKEVDMRKSFWGDYSKARAELRLPAISSLPLLTKIPLLLSVSSTTKSMKLQDTPTDPGAPIFPEPPRHSKDISLTLRRNVTIESHGCTHCDVEQCCLLGDFGTPRGEVDTIVLPKEWIASETDNHRGVWKQQTTFKTSLYLKCTPTFQYPTMRVSHFMELKVAFSGLGNNVTITIPVEIGSGRVPPDDSNTETAPAYEPEMLDLPPSYAQD